ncbi:hypothetical protein KIN20_000124 [Parelaphostrongylus tenuis]|uniref:Uncharacterized protein n=1 Tax=Parelaphostrongylus tenuis TaxID=148309 RepID=A0AAD5LUB1_PARTN|nr:hypothetical protein KIN20_000124 [Parelaphostrongylus tenuis]
MPSMKTWEYYSSASSGFEEPTRKSSSLRLSTKSFVNYFQHLNKDRGWQISKLSNITTHEIIFIYEGKKANRLMYEILIWPINQDPEDCVKFMRKQSSLKRLKKIRLCQQ